MTTAGGKGRSGQARRSGYPAPGATDVGAAPALGPRAGGGGEDEVDDGGEAEVARSGAGWLCTGLSFHGTRLLRLAAAHLL
jgi:hypothetical protein